MASLQILGDQNHARFGEFTALFGAGSIASFAPGDPLPNRTLIVVSGWAARQRWLPDGRRQILKLNLPGDVCGLFASVQSADPPVALTQTQALLGTFAATAMNESLLRDGLAGPMRAILEFEEWCVFNQLLRLGAMTAKERMAHLLLELYHRLASVRLAQDWSFEMPLTQEQLADVLGLSSVHINRTLQALRREGQIEWHGSRVRLTNADALAGIAHFTKPEMLGQFG
jgi:CRP-like cAMP-binding protein